jgi:hypothetical protein
MFLTIICFGGKSKHPLPVTNDQLRGKAGDGTIYSFSTQQFEQHVWSFGFLEKVTKCHVVMTSIRRPCLSYLNPMLGRGP